jgi:hypothetical protein
MSNLRDIQEKLQDTNSAIARLEKVLPNYADRPSLLLNLKSLQKRKQKLEQELETLQKALAESSAPSDS